MRVTVAVVRLDATRVTVAVVSLGQSSAQLVSIKATGLCFASS